MANQNTLSTTRVKKSPSPLLLSPKAMELVLNKERMRCDRHGQFFSLLVIQLASRATRSQVRLLARIMHKRLRLTDEKGLLLKGGIGVLLPMTDIAGARVVLKSIVNTASRNGIEFESEVFTYSGSDDDLLSGPSIEATEGDSDLVFEAACRPEDGIVDNATLQTQRFGSTQTAPPIAGKAIRADDESQHRRGVTGELIATSTLTSTHICPGYPRWKRAMDIGCASTGLLFSLPVIAIAAIAIKLTSRGPVFFRQLRTGQYGNAFPVYKLRTMVIDAEELKDKLQWLNERDGPAFKIKNDPRVTRVGGILRKTGLDELPQLWNVLVGDMAIVGPRPLPCSEDAKCETWQRRRLDTKPGLTCSWQISKSRKISFSDWMRMDLRYADRRSLLGDVRLMFKTVTAVLLGRVGH